MRQVRAHNERIESLRTSGHFIGARAPTATLSHNIRARLLCCGSSTQVLGLDLRAQCKRADSGDLSYVLLAILIAKRRAQRCSMALGIDTSCEIWPQRGSAGSASGLRPIYVCVLGGGVMFWSWRERTSNDEHQRPARLVEGPSSWPLLE